MQYEWTNARAGDLVTRAPGAPGDDSSTIGERMSGATDESLAVRAGRLFTQYRDGDQGAMGELVRTLTPILWHTVRATRLDTATAEDVLQTVWLSLVRKSDTIAEPLAVLQWMIISTKREAWRVSRGQAKVRPEDIETSHAAEPANRPSVEDEVARGEADSTLWRHINELPERCRTLLRVIAFADRPDYAELAKTLGMPQGSIGPTRGRCLAKLRLALAADPHWETT